LRSPLRRRAAAVLLLPAAAGAMGLVACGRGGDEKDAKALLDKAFRQSIRSADVKLDARLHANGLPTPSKAVRIQASGPYKQNKGKLPSYDIDLRVATGGGGQVVSTGRLSTGDRAFVKFEDIFYELPRSGVERANRSLRADRRQRSVLKQIGLNARAWVRRAKVEGDEKVAGVDTTHVSGSLDAPRLLQDLNRFVERSARALGATAGQVPRRLSSSELHKVAEVVKDPNFDVYVGKRDDIVRRMSGRLELQVPKKDRGEVGGLKGGSMEFTLEFSDVNGNQKIVAPAKARRLSDLTRSLGASALGSLGSGGGNGTSGGGTTTAPPSSSSGGGATTGPSAQDFKRYATCLDKAKAGDTRALQRCARLLKP
jgi:hypothetical protein